MSQNEIKKHYQELIANCDAFIKAGQINAVSSLIADVQLSRVPREHRLPIASICRRSGLVEQGLRLLQPVVRSSKSLEKPATPNEISEYAVLLSRNGSIDEALALLNDVETSKAPEAYLYRAFCQISGWNFEKAVDDLRKYISMIEDPYAQLIARVNLASSYLRCGRLELAEGALEEAIQSAQQSNAQRLVGNCLEMKGELFFRKGDWAKARLNLEKASVIFSQSRSYDQLLVRKWQWILEATEKNDVTPLQTLRREALASQHWESVREADLFTLQIRFDQTLFNHLYFGTPLSSYRSRILQQINQEPSEFYVIGSANGQVFDLESGHLQGEQDLNPGKKIHQLLCSLMKDFYVPRNMGVLFADLYPGEYFDVESSPVRVRQILSRARQWFDKNKIPANIEQMNGQYRLILQKGFGVRVPLESSINSSEDLKWKEIQGAFPLNSSFTAQEACERLNLSRTGFHRLSRWALDNGYLKKVGSSKSTLYQIEQTKRPGYAKKTAA